MRRLHAHSEDSKQSNTCKARAHVHMIHHTHIASPKPVTTSPRNNARIVQFQSCEQQALQISANPRASSCSMQNMQLQSEQCQTWPALSNTASVDVLLRVANNTLKQCTCTCALTICFDQENQSDTMTRIPQREYLKCMHEIFATGINPSLQTATGAHNTHNQKHQNRHQAHQGITDK